MVLVKTQKRLYKDCNIYCVKFILGQTYLNNSVYWMKF